MPFASDGEREKKKGGGSLYEYYLYVCIVRERHQALFLFRLSLSLSLSLPLPLSLFHSSTLEICSTSYLLMWNVSWYSALPSWTPFLPFYDRPAIPPCAIPGRHHGGGGEKRSEAAPRPLLSAQTWRGLKNSFSRVMRENRGP